MGFRWCQQRTVGRVLISVASSHVYMRRDHEAIQLSDGRLITTKRTGGFRTSYDKQDWSIFLSIQMSRSKRSTADDVDSNSILRRGLSTELATVVLPEADARPRTCTWGG